MEFQLDGDISVAILEAQDIIRKEIKKFPITIQLIGRLDGVDHKGRVQHCRNSFESKLNFLFNELKETFSRYDSITLIVKAIKPRQRACPKCNKLMRSDNIARHLKSCGKDSFCHVCQKEVDGDVEKHVETCCVETFSCKVCSRHFNTGARRTAHEKQCSTRISEETAIGGLFRIVTIKPSVKTDDFVGFFKEEYLHIIKILKVRMNPTLKFYFTMKLNMIKLVGDDKMVAVFNTSATTLLQIANAFPLIKHHLHRLEEKVDQFIQNGSDWVIDSVNQIDVMMIVYNPLDV